MLYSGAKGTMTPNNRLQRTHNKRGHILPFNILSLASLIIWMLKGKMRCEPFCVRRLVMRRNLLLPAPIFL
jgi:hypothetical protein